MKIEVISGTAMLTLCHKEKEIVNISKEHKSLQFTHVEHNGQHLFFEGDIVIPSAENHVVIVTKNADFTEGRGPMNFHKVFWYLSDAIDYIMTQAGIYGSTQGASNYAGVSIHGKPYCVSGFNGYDVKIVEVE
jgi:hypothetical protein